MSLPFNPRHWHERLHPVDYDAYPRDESRWGSFVAAVVCVGMPVFVGASVGALVVRLIFQWAGGVP